MSRRGGQDPTELNTKKVLDFDGARRRMITFLRTTDFRAEETKGWNQGGLVNLLDLRAIINMNRLGMLTYNSQAGSRLGKYVERAYVLSAMPLDRARLFVDHMAENSDVLCFCSVFVPNLTRSQQRLISNIWVTRFGTKFTTRVTLAMPLAVWKRECALEMGVRANGLAQVTCVDLRWGRPARKHLHPIILRSLKAISKLHANHKAQQS